ncbi:MAG: hypothetical protein WAO78_02880 [Roseovarius sp.]
MSQMRPTPAQNSRNCPAPYDHVFDLHRLTQEGGEAEGLSLEWMLDRYAPAPSDMQADA